MKPVLTTGKLDAYNILKDWGNSLNLFVEDLFCYLRNPKLEC